MSTVRVRIALAVDRNGAWSASGWNTKSTPANYERDVFGCVIENLEPGEARYWVEAEVALPAAATVLPVAGEATGA